MTEQELQDMLAVNSAQHPPDPDIETLVAEVRRLRKALERIAAHDGGRYVWDDDGIVDRQPSPQEIAAEITAQAGCLHFTVVFSQLEQAICREPAAREDLIRRKVANVDDTIRRQVGLR